MKIHTISSAQQYFTRPSSQKPLDIPKVSIETYDPILGTYVIHGMTNKRPKAYAGEHIACPWDSDPQKVISFGSAFLVVNDYPALSSESQNTQEIELDSLYTVKPALGECMLVIYSPEHTGHWLTLTSKEREDIVGLWVLATERAKKIPGCVYTQLFENDGPLNTMTHPHGQQYNFMRIPPGIQEEINRCQTMCEKNGEHLFSNIVEVEKKVKERIVYENASFIAYVPPGARWPYQVRVLPKEDRLWLTEFTKQEKKDFADILTIVRFAYENIFTTSYKPTIMMTLHQAPFDDNEVLYRMVYGVRVEFFITALSPNAEKYMFSVENSTGYILYSQTPEDIARIMRESLIPRKGGK